MAVNLEKPTSADLTPVAGVKLGIARAGIKTPGRKDVLVMRFSDSTVVSGVFTKNRFCAAPVTVCKENLSEKGGIRALVVNTGNANAGTGRTGYDDCQKVCAALASELSLKPSEILPFSTGVIMEPLPVSKITDALPQAIADLKEDNWGDAAEAIMTTDTIAKAASITQTVNGKTFTVTGIAKGSGMIHPNMATMLSFVTTDAKISRTALEQMIKTAVNKSFNCITVDGDTSTNDSLIFAATGASGADVSDPMVFKAVQQALSSVCLTLAQKIIRDGEGASKFITIKVEGGKSEDECRKVAYAVAHSPLVKTAFFASDPNLGRILAAIGYAGIDDLDVSRIDLYLDDVLVVEKGGRCQTYREEDGQRVMNQPEITVRVCLNRAHFESTVYTCDLSHEYVSINADYRS